MAIITWSTLEQAGTAMKNPFQSSTYRSGFAARRRRWHFVWVCVSATSFRRTEESDTVFSRNQRLLPTTVVWVIIGRARNGDF